MSFTFRQWWGKLLSRPYEKTIESVQQQVSGISEPVLSIVKTFDEKGRWRLEEVRESHLFYRGSLKSGRVTDNKTGEVFDICFTGYIALLTITRYVTIPNNIHPYSLPYWMTEAEKEYVASEANKRLDVLAKRAKRVEDREDVRLARSVKKSLQQERERFVALYCKET